MGSNNEETFVTYKLASTPATNDAHANMTILKIKEFSAGIARVNFNGVNCIEASTQEEVDARAKCLRVCATH